MIRIVLADLDDTLFDHSHATRMALAALRDSVRALGTVSLDDLDARHRVLLETMHLEVLAGRVSIDDARVERFRRLLGDIAEGDEARALAIESARRYRASYEQAWRPVPGALTLLRAIRDAGARVVVVTNNIVLEQRLKLAHCAIDALVDGLVTSEETGFTKPDPRIFHHALAAAGVSANDAVMIGDAWHTDIDGARAAGIRAVWLNRSGAESPDRSVAMVTSLEDTAAVLDALGVSCQAAT
jgi:putative hydrolase of the HAD superfamily